MKPLAIITGVGPGTGAAMARRFHSGGYRVAMIARNADRLGELAKELPDAFAVPCDVSDSASLLTALDLPELIAENAAEFEATALALARDPEILLLDEPTANLDPAATRSVEEIVLSAARSGIKIVMASHDLGQVRRLAGDVIFLVRGALCERGTAEDFLDHPMTTEAAAFLRGDLVI